MFYNTQVDLSSGLHGRGDERWSFSVPVSNSFISHLSNGEKHATARFGTYNYFDILMKIFAGCGECLRCCIFEIPEFVFHATVEFMGILFTFQVKFHTNCGIL